MVKTYIALLIIIFFTLCIPFNANSQVPLQVCEVIQITSADLGSGDPTVCGNGTGILFSSRADILNNGHADQQDLFFADVTDPFNPIFFQLTNTPQGEGRLSISDDCREIAFNSRSDFVGMNPSNFDQLFSADISDLNNPSFTQLTNTANNASVNGSISGTGTKIALSTSEDITGMNPEGNREYFIFDFNNGVVPFEQLTNDTSTVGSITSTPIINANGSRVAFTSSENYMPPNSNANGGRELYLSGIAYNPPNVPFNTLFQITNFPNNSFRAQGLAFTPDGNTILFGSNADITGMNSDGNTDLFVVDVTDPSNPFFTQITKSEEFTASTGIIDEGGNLVAFITDNQNFVCGRGGGGDGIILANIANVNNPVFIPLTNFPPGTDLDDLSSPDEFTFIAFESDSDLIFGNNTDGNDEIYIIFPENCSCFLAAIPTLSEWGLIAMAGILGIVGFMVIRRRKVAG